MGIENS